MTSLIIKSSYFDLLIEKDKLFFVETWNNLFKCQNTLFLMEEEDGRMGGEVRIFFKKTMVWIELNRIEREWKNKRDKKRELQQTFLNESNQTCLNFPERNFLKMSSTREEMSLGFPYCFDFWICLIFRDYPFSWKRFFLLF